MKLETKTGLECAQLKYVEKRWVMTSDIERELKEVMKNIPTCTGVLAINERIEKLLVELKEK